MRLRGKSIRRKIVALLLVPLVSLTGLWAFATVITGSEAVRLLSVGDVMRKVGFPSEEMVRVLQKERRQTMVYLADPRRSDALAELRDRQRATDRMVTSFRSRVGDEARHEVPAEAANRFRAIEKTLDSIEGLRRKVEDNTVTRYSALQSFNELVDPYYDFLASLSALKDAGMDRQGRALVGLGRAREALSREDALLAAALAAGSMSRQDLRAFSDRVAERKILYSTHLAVLSDADRKAFDDFWRGAGADALRSAEDTVILAGAARAPHVIDAQRWKATATPVLDDLGRMGNESAERFGERVRPVAVGVLSKAAAAGVLGLAALVCSLVISLRVGRGLVRDLRRLRKEAHEISGVRLPAVMRRLAAGERVDIDAEAPRRDRGTDELGQVGQALDTLQRAAVEAAVKQADMRRGVSDVFVNLARRSQVLLHRQLTLLDTMERRTEDTDELADLFRLDHLTTRMRRHAEGLVILSGAAPSRQWRKPIQLMDVVRAAVGEVEAYERIEVRRLPRLALNGPAVADLTHLLAELLENATVFSPPHTTVQVVGERVSNGFTLEIHDRGLGLTPDALLEANLRLAETPEFELSDTDRLGLFVVSRLAQRQGVRVSLQPSPYGGTTAVVLIPSTLLTDTLPPGGARAGGEDTGGVPLPHRRTSPGRPASGGAAAGEAAAVRALDGGPGEQHHQAPDGPGPDRTPPGGLPRRVRQASLVPQLKEGPAARTRPVPDPAGPGDDRDAEEVRARMAAMQRGWQRGREQDEAPERPDVTNSPSTTAPGTTFEGDGR
ncbi:nitrate- and nitrite sensing domain-containing protein [Streptomyces sp. SCA3-4]|uniref:sensor histidine kinase n=1 Tax=Streptomyces sichuanensis TaxID=2871810 RepID=UPI001CE36E32|nr:nitrate- and nitrite sensing domain-containing protein [Streptomyces sichuanensis]MCA6096259.1 nitrate- and nitrite sensing domain-containing protein [Streptomyces sichuanensis]